MKSIVILSALLASTSVFASPLASVQGAAITPSIKLATWSKGWPSIAQLTAFSAPNAKASCTLDYTLKGQSPQFGLVSQEPKQDGFVFSFAPETEISLKLVSQKSEIDQHKGYCNGEPELCDNTDYNQTLETLTFVDAAANEYTLRCIGDSVAAPAQPAPIQTSDVQMPGLSLQ